MTEERARRKLSGILSADAVGYSRLMQEDEESTIRTLADSKELMAGLIQQYRGRVVDAPGDNLLAEFGSVVDATECAVKIQQELKTKNADKPANRKMEFRIGVNLGDVVEEAGRIYGDGVNIAARLEGLAEPGGICISGIAFDQVKNKLKLGYESLGEHSIKNIAEPVRVYKVLMEPEYAGKLIGEEKPESKKWRLVAFGALVLIILVAGVLIIWNNYFRVPPEPASLDKMAYPLPDKPSIAILAFDNLSGDPEQGYFSDGLTEEIITALSKSSQIFVVARNSSFTYKGKPVKVQQVSEELGVRYVLEGSVRKDSERVRITAQLIDAVKGIHLWAERYDRDLKDIFAIQDDITKQIIGALHVELTIGEDARISARSTNSLDAYLKFLQAREYHMGMTKNDIRISHRLAKEVISIDPEYGNAYALLGANHMMDVWLQATDSPKQSIGKAIELERKAISLGVNAHHVLGFIYSMIGQHDKAIAECRQAVELAPNSTTARMFYGLALNKIGRFEEAVHELEQGVRLDPFASSTILRSLGIAYANVGRFEDAISVSKRAIEKAPDDLLAHIVLIQAYSLANQEKAAQAEAEEVLRINPNFSLKLFEKSLGYKNQADTDRMIATLRKAGLPEHPPLQLPDKPSIAVLAFVNLSGDPDQEYFSDGITEEIITALSKTPKLFVIARTSSFKYKGKDVDLRTVGRDLGVRYVLEGSVRKAADKVRITAQLIDAKTNNHVWTERYDRELKDIFTIQDDITKQIITALQVELTEGEQAGIYARGTDNLEAYLKAMKANWLQSQPTKESVLQARQLAEEAIELDPDYAFPYKILGSYHMWVYWFKLSKNPQESFNRGIELFRKAIELDDTLAIAHIALGYYLMQRRQYDVAIAAGKRAIELEPNSADAINGYATILTMVGEYDEAIPLFKEAIRLNPKPPTTYLRFYGIAFRDSGRYDEAIVQAQKATEQEPKDLIAWILLTSSLSLAGRDEEAREAAKEILKIRPKFSVALFEKRSPQKDQAVVKRYCDALRKAGLPD
jgi:adenylate cyclase